MVKTPTIQLSPLLQTAENRDSLMKPTISEQNKRKRNDEDEESKDIKKDKTVGVRADLEE
jgi:hypothetical protein